VAEALCLTLFLLYVDERNWPATVLVEIFVEFEGNAEASPLRRQNAPLSGEMTCILWASWGKRIPPLRYGMEMQERVVLRPHLSDDKTVAKMGHPESERWGTRRVKDGVPGEWKMGHPQIG